MVFIFTEAFTQPITVALSILLIATFIYIRQRGLGYSDVGMSYNRVLGGNQYWRCGSSQFSHIDFPHLVFNLVALWSLAIIEQAAGILFYAKTTCLLLLFSPFFSLACYHIIVKHLGREIFGDVTAVGYSGILFGLMTVCAVEHPSGLTILPIFGSEIIPTWATPLVSLAITQLLVPRASFIGHLAGIFAGLLVCIPIFDLHHQMEPNIVTFTLFGIAVIGLAINYVMFNDENSAWLQGLNAWGARFRLPRFWRSDGGDVSQKLLGP